MAPFGVSVPSIAVVCLVHIAFERSYDLVTPDGRLDEELYGIFVISEGMLLDDSVPINAGYSSELDGFDGSFALDGDFDRITASEEVGSVYSGEFSVIITETDGNTALATRKVLAVWVMIRTQGGNGFQ